MTRTYTKTIVLVDGSSYLFRAYHALPSLTTSKGLATGAVKGVLNMLLSLQKQYPTDYFAVVFDAKGKTFRNDIYNEYKANRPPMPDDLREQIQPLHDVIDALGIPRIVVDNVEADDVIGTLSKQGVEKGYQVIISTSDKDMAQLVNPNVVLIDTMKNSILDEAGVEKKFGIPPSMIIDFLALMGDKSDNIPGMPGVGEKTALGLLQGIGNIDAIYQNLDKVAELSLRGAKTLATKIEANKDLVDLSYTLATIKLDCELPIIIDDISLSEQNTDALRELYRTLEFRSWLEKLDSNTNKDSTTHNLEPEQEINYQIIIEQAHFELWLDKLKKADAFAFDTETTSINYMNARIVGLSFAVAPYEAAYVPLAHNDMTYPQQLDKTWVLDKLKPLLEDENKSKIGQHLKYDAHILEHEGIYLRGIAFDTMLESYVLNSTATRHDMDSLAQNYLNVTTTKFTDIAGKGAKQLRFDDIPIDAAGPYAAEDADITLRLHQILHAKLEKEPSLLEVYKTIEQPLIKVLQKIEHYGVQVDKQLLFEQSHKIAQQLNKLEHQAYELAGQEFNLNSTKQLGEILFEKLKLPVIKKTPKGAPSTVENVLVELSENYELPKLLLEYRSLAKLKSTYTDKLPLAIYQESGRVHSSYHQAVAATGRLSSSDPNLQNIPIRNEAGRRIRTAFTAPDGCTIVAADYSQVELRIMAHLSNDSVLLKAFNDGVDIHRATAAEILSKPMTEITAEERRRAKAVNFGLIYGMSAFGLAKQLGVTRGEAQEYIDLYFARYTGVAEFMDNIRKQATDTGYVETLRGRRLYLPNINAKNGMLRQAAQRTAINAPMQGTAADIIKLAMIQIDHWLSHEPELGVRMIMQVHDELVFEVPTVKLDSVNAKIKSIMEQAEQLSVPLIVDVGTGENWNDAH